MSPEFRIGFYADWRRAVHVAEIYLEHFISLFSCSFFWLSSEYYRLAEDIRCLVFYNVESYQVSKKATQRIWKRYLSLLLLASRKHILNSHILASLNFIAILEEERTYI